MAVYANSMTHLCRCAAEFRRTHPLRPPPEPDECTHGNPACHAVEIRHPQLQITALIWFISWPNDRHDNRRFGHFRRRCHYTRDRARPRTPRRPVSSREWTPDTRLEALGLICPKPRSEVSMSTGFIWSRVLQHHAEILVTCCVQKTT